MAELASARIGDTFNQYAHGARSALLRSRLADYLEAHARAATLVVGEAPGYRGARVSGLPFTSERQLTGTGPAEATATIVQRVLAQLGLVEEVLLWNVVPTHPGTDTTNRPPRPDEVRAGLGFVAALRRDRALITVGRVAERALGGPAIPHPSRGRAREFEAALIELLHRGQLVSRSA